MGRGSRTNAHVYVTLYLLTLTQALAWPHATATAAKSAAAAAAAADNPQLPTDGLPGDHDKASDEVLQWFKQNGGQVNVAVRRVPGRGRGMFAVQDMEPGDVLASIPVELVYAANYSLSKSFEGAGAQMALDMADPDSFWQPYFSSLPEQGEAISYVHLPRTYLPIIQDANAEAAIRMLQDNLKHYCSLLQPAYTQQQLEVNISHCAHGVALLMTRAFWYGDRAVMLPIVDVANHDNACLHKHGLEPCDIEAGNKQRAEGLPPPEVPASFASGAVIPADTGAQPAAACSSEDSAQQRSRGQRTCDASPVRNASSARNRGVSGICIVWRAESTVAKGSEVCHYYGLLLQDNALLQYGFLQAGDIALELSMLDRPEHSQKFEEVWDKPKSTWGQPLPHKFRGTAQEIQAEVQRLSERLQALRAGDAAVAAIKVHKEDPGGKMLSMLLEWRQQRLRAIELEIQRLTVGRGADGVDAMA